MGISRVEMHLEVANKTEDKQGKLESLQAALNHAKVIKHRDYITLIEDKIEELKRYIEES